MLINPPFCRIPTVYPQIAFLWMKKNTNGNFFQRGAQSCCRAYNGNRQNDLIIEIVKPFACHHLQLLQLFFAKTAVFATRNCHRLESLPHLLHLTELRHSEHFKEPSLRISNFSSRQLTQISSTKHSKNLFGSFLDLKWSITVQFFEANMIFSWSATGMDFFLRGIPIVCVRCHWAMLLIGVLDIYFKKTSPSNDKSTFSVDTRFSNQKMFDDNVG